MIHQRLKTQLCHTRSLFSHFQTKHHSQSFSTSSWVHYVQRSTSDSVDEEKPVTKLVKKLQEANRRQQWKQTATTTTKRPTSVANTTISTTNSNQFVRATRSQKSWKDLPVQPNVRNYIERVQGGKYFTTRNVRVDKMRSKNRVAAPRSKRIESGGGKTPPPFLALYNYIFDNKKVKFVASSTTKESIPHPYLLLTGKQPEEASKLQGMKYLPEVAFAGRSNVGKSSLLNSLVNSKGKARVGDKPGLTQSINFYRVANNLNFIDLPGYGFAFADDEKSRAWNDLVKWFLYDRFHHSKTLKRVFVLIDARHGLKSSDYDFLQYLSLNKIQNQIILTKNDLVPGDELAKKMYSLELAMKEDEITFRYTMPSILLASSKSNSGVHDLQRIICSFVEPQKLSDLKKKLDLHKAQNQVLF